MIQFISIFYFHTKLMVNTWNISSMLIVLWKSTPEIRTHKNTIKPQSYTTNTRSLDFWAQLAFSLQHRNIPEVFLMFVVFLVW